MTQVIRVILGTFLIASLATACAQGEYIPAPGQPCGCPDNQDPVSDDYRDIEIVNQVLRAVLGLSGTVTWSRA